MSRKRNSIAPSASLFPFLSILACVIGVLTLMIGLLAPSQAEVRENPRETGLDEHLAAVQEQIDFAKVDLKRLDQRREQAETVLSQHSRSDDELQSLKARHEERQQKAQTAVELKSRLRAEAESFQRQADELEPKLAELDKRAASLQADLNERLKPPPEAVTTIRGYGLIRNIEPVFVECRADGIALHELDEPRFVPNAELHSNPEFNGLLERMANTPNGAVIFMVRSDALNTYFAARKLAREKSCRNGKLPIVGQGPIDLHLVKRQLDEERTE